MRDDERGTTAGVWEWGDLDSSVPSTNCLRVSARKSQRHQFGDQNGPMMENLRSEIPDPQDGEVRLTDSNGGNAGKSLKDY